MSHIKVKINKVNNLTDARYFAAMGVDYLGFCCNTGTEMYCSPSKIKDITSWVQGPTFVLEFDGWQSEEEIKAIIATELGQAVHFGAFATYGDTFEIPVFKDFILENLLEADFSEVDYPVFRSDKNYLDLTDKELKVLKEELTAKKAFLDIHFDIDTLPKILDTLPIYGLVIRGGGEEKIGFKSFEELDNIFEILESNLS